MPDKCLKSKTRKTRTAEERYFDNASEQKAELLRFAVSETEWAGYLIRLYKQKKMDMPDLEYRGVSYFLNKEYEIKRGSLSLCRQVYAGLENKFGDFSRELAFELLRFRFWHYGKALNEGGYSGNMVGG